MIRSAEKIPKNIEDRMVIEPFQMPPKFEPIVSATDLKALKPEELPVVFASSVTNQIQKHDREQVIKLINCLRLFEANTIERSDHLIKRNRQMVMALWAIFSAVALPIAIPMVLKLVGIK